MKLHRAEVISRESFANHALLRYRWEGKPPRPGQFVMARAGRHASVFEPFLCRPFFVHDYASGVASLLFEVRGRGAGLLAEEDAEILVSVPSGRGFTVDGGPVALVGGGVWVSPLKLLSRTLAELRISHDMYLEVPEAAPRAYATWLSENYPDATLIPTDGTSDAPQTVLECVGDFSRYCALYVSGAAGTLAAVKSASEGVTSAQLAVRERMACANGSCHGCAVAVWREGERTYARACVEGPVFPAEVLVW